MSKNLKMPQGTSKEVQNKVIMKLTQHGAELISFDKGRKVRYRCSCGNETQSITNNIIRTWGGSCCECSNQKNGNKNNYEFAKRIWEENGETLPLQEYKGNKNKLHYIHSGCDQEAHISLNEFRRGRRCENCSKIRAKATNIERYGVENVFQSEEIKDKIKETNMMKYGVNHHMKVPEILQKAIDTNLEKYGHSFSFHSEESITKARATCIEKYGVEFPMQCEYIRDKVIEACHERFGVDYPFQSKEIQYKILNTFLERYGIDKYNFLLGLRKEICLERYGVEFFTQAEDIKKKIRETCLERYGVECALQNEDIKQKIRETCLERYGVEFPMQCEDIFRKCLSSCLAYKSYTFPSGRVEKCQGYEPRCFNHLLLTYNEVDIEVGYKGREAIWYSNPKNNWKLSRYYPDGFIISENAVLEVKSEWTYEKEKLKNKAKFKKVVDMGFNLHLYVFDERNLLYREIHTKDSISVHPHPPVELVFEE